jgi:hypothetical protein
MRQAVALILVSLLAVPLAADAQLGGLGKKKKKDEPTTDDPVIIAKSRAASAAAEGAKTGAMTGAGIGAMTGGAEEAAAGAAIGAAAGAAAGSIYGEIKDRQLRSRDEAIARHEYTPDRGVLVVIESIEADPTAVARGGNLAFTTVYTVLAPSEKDKIAVDLGYGVVLAELDEQSDQFEPGKLEAYTVKRGGGTFEVTVPLVDTSAYEPHSYKYIVGVKAGAGYAQDALTFDIVEG